MSFARYSEYKDSGVEWVGAIPSHWSLPRLRHVSRIKNGSDYKSIQSDNGAYPVIGSGGEFARGTDYLFNGESVLLGRKGTVDKPMYVNGPFWTVDTMFYTQIGASAHVRFVYYCACNFPYAQLSTNTALPSMAQEDLANLRLPLPDYREQSVIASFLDHETAKIDALIEEQQRLIELLKEKRQAVISHAVTRGLDPDAPMKDSGVEWLGDVPAHWEVIKIKRVAQLKSGHTPSKSVPEYWEDCSVPWVSLNDSKKLAVQDYIEDTTHKVNEAGLANSSAHILPAQAVVFTRDATIGLSAITTRPMAVSQHLIAWVCGPKILPEYLLLVLYAMEEELQRMTFGATIKTIGMPEVNRMVTPVPPMEEQKAIVDQVFETREKLASTHLVAEQIIRLLKERRSALISAAVTGKIDVRNWQSQSDAMDELPMAAEASATYEARES